jgi:lipopolysaccharide/colanic/teichoic acid biosynthesis glycosyltransferase
VGLRRGFDLALAALGLLAALPLIALAAAAIVAEDRGPVFYSQMRVGRRGLPFRIFKLRSMTVMPDGPTITAADDSRVTRTGRILRRYKLDELPQFWNVLRGDMSFIGPRPEVERFVDRTDPRWQQILTVRPGITDAATLLFLDEESLLAGITDREEYYREQILPAKLKVNLEHLRDRSFRRDLKLLADTATAILSQPRQPDWARVRRTLP